MRHYSTRFQHKAYFYANLSYSGRQRYQVIWLKRWWSIFEPSSYFANHKSPVSLVFKHITIFIVILYSSKVNIIYFVHRFLEQSVFRSIRTETLNVSSNFAFHVHWLDLSTWTEWNKFLSSQHFFPSMKGSTNFYHPLELNFTKHPVSFNRQLKIFDTCSFVWLETVSIIHGRWGGWE